MTTAPLDLTAAIAEELTYLRGGNRAVTNKLLAEAADLSERQVIRIFQGEPPVTIRQLDQFATVLSTDSRTIINDAYKRIARGKPVK